mmetsp:Transcript_58376/g.151732  ORF Transcript_58376/g.151732 Transcript_58376/m.151732 type:complete len:163 (-) Transcript_58376:219-707(-)
MMQRSSPGMQSPGMQRQPANMVGGGGGTTFYNVSMQLSEELVNQLTVEHATETKALYKQITAMREELGRCGELMQGFVDREKAITEMMQQLQQAYEQTSSSLADMHGKFGDMTNHGIAKPDPVKDSEVEIQRIGRLLSSPAVPPPSVPPHLQQLVKSPIQQR